MAPARSWCQASWMAGAITSPPTSADRSPPQCSCELTFSSCTMLANHLDIQHNVHHAGVSRQVPVVYLIYIDRPALPPTTGPSPSKQKRKT